MEPLGDSILLDNSLLEGSAAMTTTSNSSTEDSNSESRHPLPNTPHDSFSKSSTPIHSSSSGNGSGSSTTSTTQKGAESDSQFSDFEFWKSPIPKVEDGTEDRLAGGVQDMSLEDIETNSSIEQGATGGEKEDKLVKEELNLGKDGVNSDIQNRLNFDEERLAGGEQDMSLEGLADSPSEEQSGEKEAKSVKEELNLSSKDGMKSDVQSPLNIDRKRLTGSELDKPLGELEDSESQVKERITSAEGSKESREKEHTQEDQTKATDEKVQKEATTNGETSSPPSSSNCPPLPSSSSGNPGAPPSDTVPDEGKPRGTDVAMAMDDAMRIRSCSAGSSLRSELGSNLVFGEGRKGQGETKKRRWSLDKMNKLQENNTLPPVSRDGEEQGRLFTCPAC